VTTTSGAAYDERLHIADGSLNSIVFASQSKKKTDKRRLSVFV